MTIAGGLLTPLVRPLPQDVKQPAGRWVSAHLTAGLTLVVGGPDVGRDELPVGTDIVEAGATSRSKAGGRRALAVATNGRVGVDIETLARVALNADVGDAWLTLTERALVAGATSPVAELACHWVLKEAFGKSLGVGLAMPLDRLGFGARDGLIVLHGPAAPAWEQVWRLALYRHDELIVGVAYRRSGHAVGASRQKAADPAGRQVQRP